MKVKHSSLIECGQHRLRSRSISYSSSGSYLAIASSCSAVRLHDGSAGKEVLVFNGHSAPVTIARFHPTQENVLVSASTDATVRIWDVRDPRNSTGKVTDVPAVLALEWNPIQSNLFLLAKRSGDLTIYDRRKLAGAKVEPVYSHSCEDRVPDAAVFEPTLGESVYFGSTERGEGTADIRIWNFDSDEMDCRRYLAHAGPIYAMAFQHDGRRLVSGGADAIVGIWDVQGSSAATSMCCTKTISNRTKFIRGIAVSADSELLAVATEEGVIDLARMDSAQEIAQISLGDKSKCAGAEAVAFHPTAKYTLACARVSDHTSHLRSPATIIRLDMQ